MDNGVMVLVELRHLKMYQMGGQGIENGEELTWEKKTGGEEILELLKRGYRNDILTFSIAPKRHDMIDI